QFRHDESLELAAGRRAARALLAAECVAVPRPFEPTGDVGSLEHGLAGEVIFQPRPGLVARDVRAVEPRLAVLVPSVPRALATTARMTPDEMARSIRVPRGEVTFELAACVTRALDELTRPQRARVQTRPPARIGLA